MPVYRVPARYSYLGFPESVARTLHDAKLGLLEDQDDGRSRAALLEARQRFLGTLHALTLLPEARSRFDRDFDL